MLSSIAMRGDTVWDLAIEEHQCISFVLCLYDVCCCCLCLAFNSKIKKFNACYFKYKMIASKNQNIAYCIYVQLTSNTSCTNFATVVHWYWEIKSTVSEFYRFSWVIALAQ